MITSIIHGKASHEETRATASRALGADGQGHFVIVLNLEEAGRLAEFMVNGGDAADFLNTFQGAVSPGFDPMQHLQRIGVANQTTMLRSETEAIQNLLREAVARRDGGSTANFRYFDTICGATQDRQDALFQLLKESLEHADRGRRLQQFEHDTSRRDRLGAPTDMVHPKRGVPDLGREDPAL
jgi:4-hydroxy-3-methylbut-2-enyl diphosphate reductase